MITSGGIWFPPDDPDWTPPVEWTVAVTGARPTAVELMDLPLRWTAWFCLVDEIRNEAERRQAEREAAHIRKAR